MFTEILFVCGLFGTAAGLVVAGCGGVACGIAAIIAFFC
jgi:hypothetical protein